MDIERAKAILEELQTSTEYRVHPANTIGDKTIIYPGLFRIPLDGEYDDKYREYLLALGCEPTLYDFIKKFSREQWEIIKERERMHRIYATEIGIDKLDINGDVIGENRFKLYDMSVLKLQTEVGHKYDKEYFKTVPDYVKDISRFTELVAPFDFATTYLINYEEQVVLDLRKLVVYKIPVASETTVE
jgi:hypothetical protein